MPGQDQVARRPPSNEASLLGDLLVRRGRLTADQLKQIRALQEKQGTAFVTALLELGFVPEADLTKLLQSEYRLPAIDPHSIEPSPEALAAVPAAVARRHAVLPISKEGSLLTIAVADPSNIAALNEIRFVSGCSVKPVLSSPAAIRDAISWAYSESTLTALGNITDGVDMVADELTIDRDALQRATEEAPVVRLVNAILVEAIQRRASDVHLEPFRKEFRVRFRIDGVLNDVMRTPRDRLQLPLVSRVKVMAALDIAERRLPQDGRIKMRIPGTADETSVRVSVVPTVFGEKVVLRLLGRNVAPLALGDLGFDPAALDAYRQAIERPWGLVLVTGPTGSGKTTTLYSALNEIDSTLRNISTVEDPVEMIVDGVNQVQVNEDIGLTFSAMLRAFLRQDPDVIMVGEIRDGETAEIAVKAALTGHLVLSTLHTNDASATVIRLLNMGIEPFLVASSLSLVIAQRLARRICPRCREPAVPSARELAALHITPEEAAATTFFRGVGCSACSRTGYVGRTAIYEILAMTDDLRDQVLERASSSRIRNAAIAAGMRPLLECGLAKLRAGITTVEELIRVAAIG